MEIEGYSRKQHENPFNYTDDQLCEKQLALKTKNSGEEGRRGILEINERKGKMATSTPIFEKVYYCIVHGSIDPNTKCLISARLSGKNKKIDKNVPNQSKFNKTYNC